MEVTDTLDTLRSELPGCSLVIYCDVTTRLVLGSSAVSKPAQEDLDRLSETAQLVLAGAVSDGAAPVFGGTDSSVPADTAILVSTSGSRVFLRAPDTGNEALVCVSGPDTPLDAVVDCGRRTLGSIVAAQ